RTDFREIELDGQKQLTYRGWPLYYFEGDANVPGDEEPGQTKGISFPEPGVWKIVNKNDTPSAPN
ncbi:MAG TPA: hypothetical protein VEA37_02890, partial [Flavobacterium sp.]|nr:hypothetical protein [Flavobacterium sp.]